MFINPSLITKAALSAMQTLNHSPSGSVRNKANTSFKYFILNAKKNVQAKSINVRF